MPTYLSLAQRRLWLSEQAVMIAASSRGHNAENAGTVGLPLASSYANSDCDDFRGWRFPRLT